MCNPYGFGRYKNNSGGGGSSRNMTTYVKDVMRLPKLASRNVDQLDAPPLLEGSFSGGICL
jgi:hypothetical protein